MNFCFPVNEFPLHMLGLRLSQILLNIQFIGYICSLCRDSAIFTAPISHNLFQSRHPFLYCFSNHLTGFDTTCHTPKIQLLVFFSVVCGAKPRLSQHFPNLCSQIMINMQHNPFYGSQSNLYYSTRFFCYKIDVHKALYYNNNYIQRNPP